MRSLVPAVEAAGIPWREGEAYDGWDRIATALFKSIVVEPIAYATNTHLDSWADYDACYESYERCNYIRLERGQSKQTLAFYALATRHAPFDSVKCVPLDGNQPAGDALLVSIEDVRYVARCHVGTRFPQDLPEVSVDE